MGKLRLTYEDERFLLHTPYGTLGVLDTFLANFMKLVNLPHKAVNKNNPLTAIFNGLADRNPDMGVRFYVVGGNATTIVGDSTKIVDHFALNSIVGDLRKKYEFVEIVLGRVNSHLLIFTDELVRAFSGDGGLFSLGLHVTVPHDGSVTGEVNRALRRLLGGNISIVKNRKTSSKFDFEGVTVANVAEDLLRHIGFAMADQDQSQGSYLRDRLESLGQTKASLKELLAANSLIESRTGDWLLAEPLKVDIILDKYGLASPTERSANWCKTASTPISVLDVFNLLSGIAARHFEPNDHNKVLMATAAGRVLTKTGDLEDVAPQRDWQQFDRTNVSRLN